MEMSDARTIVGKRNSKLCTRTVVIVVGSNILLSCMVLSMVILMFSVEKPSNEPSLESMHDESDRAIMDRFTGHFRSKEDQDMLERRIRRDKPFSDTIYPTNCTHSKEKPDRMPWCTLKPAASILHACCKSDPQFVSPAYVIDVNGQNRTLAVFGHSKQWFRIEKCSQLQGCKICICKTEKVIFSTVYETNDDSKYGVTFFELDGCCRCHSL